MFKCRFCTREFTNVGARGKHEKTCQHNPDRVDQCGGKLKGCTSSWNKGLSKETDNRIKLLGEKISQTTKARHGRSHTPETKLKMSQIKKALYAAGWESTAGRCKKYDYESPIAGNIKVDGTWEIIFCKYMDFLGLTWCRNKKRFSYNNLKGTVSTYQPDFYVVNWDCFVEVKGYETDLDRCKWSQFPEKLIVCRKQEIKDMESKLGRP